MVHAPQSIHATSPELTELPARSAAVVRVDGPVGALPRLLGEAFELTANAVTASGATFAGPPFARYLRFGETVTAEVGFPYAGELVPTERVYRTLLPGGRAVKGVHVGPYETIATTWEATRTWLRDQGLVATGTPWESYLSEPDATPPVTEVLFPVR
ncbi:MAG TPA: GyrI-like domain-containing protein [Candidatus Limnocylindrales bacterium]